MTRLTSSIKGERGRMEEGLQQKGEKEFNSYNITSIEQENSKPVSYFSADGHGVKEKLDEQELEVSLCQMQVFSIQNPAVVDLDPQIDLSALHMDGQDSLIDPLNRSHSSKTLERLGWIPTYKGAGGSGVIIDSGEVSGAGERTCWVTCKEGEEDSRSSLSQHGVVGNIKARVGLKYIGPN